MRIALASDHAGVPLMDPILEQVRSLGYETLDLGTHDASKPDDYPDYARAIGEALEQGRAERGILICGSGVGAAVAANKMFGIRACMCHDTYSAHQGVEHDDMNVLCLGARVIGQELAHELVRAFLAARFSNEERHKRRLEKVLAMERQLQGASPRLQG
jgi:ribose 5-phosphate isomerase B